MSKPKRCTETYSDILSSSKNIDDKLFEKYKDFYILSAMDNAYNCLPNSKKRFSNMSETEFNAWISASNFSKPKKIYKIHVPTAEGIIDMTNSSRKTAAFVLPLSLEDNATIAGTSSILKEFETDFELHSAPQNPEFLPYDTLTKSFDVNTARSCYECMNTQSKHICDMNNFENNLRNKEKHLDGIVFSDLSDIEQSTDMTNEDDDNFNGEQQTDEDASTVTNNMNRTLESERRRFRNEDQSFWELYNNAASHVYRRHWYKIMKNIT